jgi:hypothetical protein
MQRAAVNVAPSWTRPNGLANAGGAHGWRRPSCVFRECDHACTGCSNEGCRGTLTGPMAEGGRWSPMGRGASTCFQSGTQEWNNAAVTRGRGPCNNWGRRGSILGVRALVIVAARGGPRRRRFPCWWRRASGRQSGQAGGGRAIGIEGGE